MHPTTGLPVGTRVAERYVIQRVLGKGGYAVVYLASDLLLGREVALKVLRHDRLGDRGFQRLKREARVAREADSPHVARIHDIVRDGDLVFLVMEHLAGGSVEERLLEGPLPIAHAVEIAEQVLEGLIDLHRLGIVHRDLKPANLLIADTGTIKLADFGLARHWERDETKLTETAAVVGTVEYVSPEQALGEEVDPRSDLYSFGVVLHELLTGRVPHEGKSSFDALMAHVTRPIESVRKMRPEVPRWLARIVARLLEKKPADRYPDAAAVLEDLRSRRGQRSPRVIRRTLVAAALAGLGITGAAVAWHLATEPEAFSHLVSDGDRAILAIDREGSPLWRRELPPGSFVAARLEPAGPIRVVGFAEGVQNADQEAAHTLSVLDAETGEVLRRRQLPSATNAFAGFEPRFGPGLFVMDLDGDGGDEILVAYTHTYWPSYLVLWEPRIDRARILMVASGHHRPIRPLDVDDDGRLDLLIGGYANLMGWYYSLAAIRLDPPPNEALELRPYGTEPALTPDRERGPWQNLLWYALLPPGSCRSVTTCLEIDDTSRTIRVPGVGGRTAELGFDGFLRGERSELAGKERWAAREEAFRRAGDARRLIESGAFRQAGDQAGVAIREAERAGEPMLAEWAYRLRGTALARSGRREEANRLFEDLVDRSMGPTNVAFDAAQAFHLAGFLEDAVDWYHVGLGEDPTGGLGRFRYEFVDGLVFALAELGRWDEAAAAPRIYFGPETDQTFRGSIAEAWIEWRRGGSPPPLEIWPGSTDFERHLAMELRRARGDDPDAMLAEVEAGVGIVSDTEALARSLEAELLADLGRETEALSAARSAWDLALAKRGSSTLVRAHVDLIGERYARRLEAAGSFAEATRVRRAAHDPRAAPAPSPAAPAR